MNYKDFIGKTISAVTLYKMLQIDEYPIDISNIIEELGIPVNTSSNFANPAIIGSIKVENNKPKIFVNRLQNQHEGRKRFTLAHELGHFMLHIAPNFKDNLEVEDYIISFNRDDNWSFKEYEANTFASSLLMPVPLLQKAIDHIKKDNPNIDRLSLVSKLAKYFEVSVQAMEYRLSKVTRQ